MPIRSGARRAATLRRRSSRKKKRKRPVVELVFSVVFAVASLVVIPAGNLRLYDRDMTLFESLASDFSKVRGYSDWEVFDSRLEDLVKAGQARRVQGTRIIRARDEEWYLDPASGEIYVYTRPDDKVLPAWSKVDVFAEPKGKETILRA